MALTTKWAYYSGGWTSFSSSPPNRLHAAIGPYDGDSHYRTCLKLELDNLESGKKRDTINIKLNIVATATYGTKVTEDTITAELRTGAPNGYDWGNYGTILKSQSRYVDFTLDNYFEIDYSFDISDRTASAQTLYVYFYSRSNKSASYHIFKFKDNGTTEVNEITGNVAPSMTNVTTNSITTTNGQFFTPTQTVAFAWDAGTNGTGGNNVSGYLTCMSYYLNNTYKETSQTTVYTTSTSCAIPNADRGTEIKVWVKALGSGGLHGEWKAKVLGKVNNKPTISKVTSTGTKITDNTSITFTANIASNDTGQTAYLEYYLNETGWKRIESGSELKIDKNFSGLNTTNSNNTIKFRVNDNVETTQYNETFNFTTSYKPVLSNPSVNFSQLKNMQGSVDSYLTKFVNGTYTTSGSVSIKAEIITSTSSNISEGNLTPKDISSAISILNSNTFQLDVTKLSTSDLPYGNYFKFRFAVTNAEGSSNYTQWYGPKRRPYQPSLPTNCTASNRATNQYGTLAKADYFESKIGITASNPTSTSGYAKISSISLILNNNTQQPLNWNSSINSEQTIEFTIGDEINNGGTASFIFIVTDEAGQTAQTQPFGNLIKSSGLNFTGKANVNPTNIRPLVNDQDFIIDHPYASDTGSSIAYRYKFSLNKTTTYLTPDTIDNTDLYEKSVTINTTNINSYLLGKIGTSERDKVYEGELVVSAINGFGTEVKLAGIKFYANFLEPPVFNSVDFKIGHDFNINGSAPSSLSNEITSGLSASHANRMFNHKEGIIFALPKATDPNEDFVGYNIYLVRQDMTLNGTAMPYENISFGSKPWLYIPKNGLLSKGDYYYYRHSMSQLAKNEYLYFQVKAVDATNLESDAKTFKSYLIGCRTMPASFNVDTKVSRGQNKITVDYKINITDLGGSALASGWNESFYNAYKNFERSINNYNKGINIKVEFSDNPNFTNAQFLDLTPLNPVKNLLDYTGHDPDGNGYSSVSFDTSGDVSKIYVRFTLYVSYTLQNSATAYITSSSKVDTNFGEVPTVSHRAHRVGINTNSVDDESVFVVEDYGATRKKIKFIGSDSQDASIVYTIEFDLSTGTITGTKIDGFIVDGGSW